MSHPSAARVVGLADARAVRVGGNQSCAIVAGGRVSCWGVGAGLAPHLMPDSLHDVTSLDVGLDSACAVVGGQVLCWGEDVAGQLGNGTTAITNIPTAVTGLPTSATWVAVGDGSTTPSLVPVRASLAGERPFAAGGQRVDHVVAEGTTSCALVDDDSPWPTDRIHCWGRNFTPTPTEITQPKYPALAAVRARGVLVMDSTNPRI